MTSLIACLGHDKGTLTHVAEIIKNQEWDSIFLVTDVKPKEFSNKKNIEWIIINPNQLLPELAEEIKNKLQNKISDIEVALNVISGHGKQHMAVLSALLKLGLGIRLIALTKQGVKEI